MLAASPAQLRRVLGVLLLHDNEHVEHDDDRPMMTRRSTAAVVALVLAMPSKVRALR